jgi:hypothetical protein
MSYGTYHDHCVVTRIVLTKYYLRLIRSTFKNFEFLSTNGLRNTVLRLGVRRKIRHVTILFLLDERTLHNIRLFTLHRSFA